MARHYFSFWRSFFLGVILTGVILAGSTTPLFAVEPHNPGNEDQIEQGVDLHLFWSRNCPHCLEALPVVEQIAKELPWVHLYALEISRSQPNRELYQQMAQAHGEEARSVPAFFFCGHMAVGFSLAETPTALRHYLQQCYESGSAPAGERPNEIPDEFMSALPLGLEIGDWSLPVTTIVIAALDAFNPCAFFVLLFLLSLLVHSGERWRMLLIGGTFILVSGGLYFLFMAAWLNLFLYLGELTWVTRIAAMVAIMVASLNIKDAFFPQLGPSLSISAQHKPGLFQRMRLLLSGDRLLPLLLGTVTLAVIANSYELLCTSGLPMVFTRILTLNQLPTEIYYLYLLLYNLIYIVPLLLIVVIFTFTLGSRKLQAEEGAFLKLLSGMMMLGLGLMLLFFPERLQSLGAAMGIMGFALLASLLLAWLKRR